MVGGQFTNTSALHGNDVATFPDFPAEIRAPRGTLAGVSGYQVQFASRDIFTPGDTLQALVAMNPAALVTNIKDLEKGGILIVNDESFKAKDLKLARLAASPLDDGTVDDYRVIKVRLDTLNREAVKEVEGLSSKLQDRCKNFFALGLIYWLFGRDIEPTPAVRPRQVRRQAGGRRRQREGVARRLVPTARRRRRSTTATRSSRPGSPPGTYRNVMGNQALAWGWSPRPG